MTEVFVHEWPLILFTLLGQLAVGSFIVLGLVNVLATPRHSAKVVDRVADPALYAIGPAMVVGLIISMLHLGNPLNAINAFRHLDTSWLSREVFFGALFAGLGFVFAVLQWRRWGSRKLRQLLAVVTALVGVFLVISMAFVYMRPTLPYLNRWTTLVGFGITTILLGCLAMGVALTGSPKVGTGLQERLFPSFAPLKDHEELGVEKLLTNTLRWIGVTTMALLPLQLLVMMFAILPPTAPDAQMHEFSMVGLVTRGILLILGAGVLGLFLFIGGREQASTGILLGLVSSAFIITIVAEFLGRIMFYAALVPTGVG